MRHQFEELRDVRLEAELRGLWRVSSSSIGHHAISNERAPQKER
jgi:hypothetical protein